MRVECKPIVEVVRKKEKFLYDFLTWVHDPNKENKQALIDNHYGGDEIYDKTRMDRQTKVNERMKRALEGALK